MNASSPKYLIPAPPKWLPWAFAGVMLTGLALFVGGPMLSLAVAYARLDAELTPEELRDAKIRDARQAEILAEHRDRDAWVIPVGMGLTGMGTMGLLFVFVTRPLGADLDNADLDNEEDPNPDDD